VTLYLAVAAIPRGFAQVKTITPKRGGVILNDRAGHRITVPLDVGFHDSSALSLPLSRSRYISAGFT
jgi:hypothetical protein